METIPERPTTIHESTGPVPRGPRGFLLKAVPGGFSSQGLQLIAAWVAFQFFTTIRVALRLSNAAGHSQIADDWGKTLTARGLWEVMGQGQVADAAPQALIDPWVVAVGAAAMLWAIWAGWKVQARVAGVAAGLTPLLLSIPTALCIGWLPLWALHAALWGTLGLLASSGIQFLCWLDFIASPLLHLCFASSLLVQWWLCRADLGQRVPRDIREWTGHMKESFARLWLHPIQWGTIVFLGVSVRTGLSFSAMLLACLWGGQSLSTLWTLFAVQALAAAANAWIIGWTLRTTALYWKNDAEVRATIRELEKGGGQ